jgi:hypothetical protein
MLATLLVVWCLASVIAAPLIGRAIRHGQSAPQQSDPGSEPAKAPRRSAEVA